MYHLTIERRAKKALNKLKDPIFTRIVHAINALKEDPRHSGCGKLKGEDNLWKVRVGSYRVVYEIDDVIRIVNITDVGHRREIYR